jgi:hypothetical protein
MTTITDLSHWDKDPRVFLFTSLTAGSSHIVTATSRIETILRANKIPFEAIDVATDETAKKLWGRRAGKKKLPGLVKEGYVIAVCTHISHFTPHVPLCTIYLTLHHTPYIMKRTSTVPHCDRCLPVSRKS